MSNSNKKTEPIDYGHGHGGMVYDELSGYIQMTNGFSVGRILRPNISEYKDKDEELTNYILNEVKCADTVGRMCAASDVAMAACLELAQLEPIDILGDDLILNKAIKLAKIAVEKAAMPKESFGPGSYWHEHSK